ncbi:MAG TPA: class I SAM-dependent methyltransferase [Pyrinomonadaceae bacterium]|jgi:2-polyprenyl-6-hydroxyphenyl methylase/3-demethylubiquinone-9 3-methyltransferase|nr:class I SAM-dependent methyltransferase [Pyrinomonadaceae bacterium]
MSSHAEEIAGGQRFDFGQNWSQFLGVLDETRIREAERSLREMLSIEDLRGRSFLDIGSGSGLFSLAARRLGASVHSFDYDPKSVACTAELRRRYFTDDDHWKIEEGSALDVNYLKSLGQFDVVYSWGVLHHTGEMWRALENVLLPVADGGKLFIAIYNDTGRQSVRWRRIKRIYNGLPRSLKLPFALGIVSVGQTKAFTRSLLQFTPGKFIRSWTRYEENRGMSRWHDHLDWIGGYPYEVATPEEIFDFYRARGFTLARLKCSELDFKLGCNEFVFEKTR